MSYQAVNEFGTFIYTAVLPDAPDPYLAIPTLSNCYLTSYASTNGTVQASLQNLNGGNMAAASWVATADIGTNTSNYVEFGINNSGNTDPNWTINGALDSYIHASNGNLAIGTGASGKNLVLFAGGTMAANAAVSIGGSYGTLLTPMYASLAASTSIARSIQSKSAEVYSILDFGAIGDGTVHTLASLTTFGLTNVSGWTLAQWQAAYPNTTALTQSVDELAFMNAFSHLPSGATLRVPAGTYMLQNASSITRSADINIVGDPGATINALNATVGAAPIFQFNGTAGSGYAQSATITAGDVTISANATLAAAVSSALAVPGARVMVGITSNGTYSGVVASGGTASFSGTVMTLTGVPSTGSVQTSMCIVATGVPTGTRIVSLASGSLNQVNSTYNLSQSCTTEGSESFTGNGATWNDYGGTMYCGELCEVISVSSSTLYLKNPVQDTYTNGTNTVALYMITPIRVRIENLRIFGANYTNGNPNTPQGAISVYYGLDCFFSGLVANGFPFYAFQSYYCIGSTYYSCIAENSYVASAGYAYGIAVDSSQGTRIQNCRLTPGRHAVKHGGYEPARDSRIMGCYLDNDPRLTCWCVDSHANADQIFVENCTILNGCTMLAQNFTIRNCKITARNNPGVYTDLGAGNGYQSNRIVIEGNEIRMPSNGGTNQAAVLIYGMGTIQDLIIRDNKCIVENSANIFNVSSYAGGAGGTSTFTINNAHIEDNIGTINYTTAIDVVQFTSCTVGNLFLNRNRFTDLRTSNTTAFLNVTSTALITTIEAKQNWFITASSGAGYAVYVPSTSATVQIIFTDNNYLNTNTAGGGNALYLYATSYVKFTNNIINGMTSTNSYCNLSAQDVEIHDNVPLGFTSTSASVTGRAYFLRRQTGTILGQGSAAPSSSGTYQVSDYIMNTGVTATTTPGWYCTTAGTLGTYSEGLTATTNGTTTVTLSGTTAVLKPFMWVTINSTTVEIVSISGTTMIVSGNITTASGQSIAYRAPTFTAAPVL